MNSQIGWSKCLSWFKKIHITSCGFASLWNTLSYSTRKGKPFTAIVDGANIAYYMQNFQGGSFNFYQLQFMVEALEKMNEKPLVILPYKYMSNKFQLLMGGTPRSQVVGKEEKKILEE